MASQEQSVTRWAIAVMVVIVSVLAFASTVIVVLFQNRDLNKEVADTSRLLVECTTPGPDPVNAEGNTGHKCYDDGQRRTAKAISLIVDADGDGDLDSVEILEALRRLDQPTEGAQG